jgi:hypothetical protein
METPSNTSLNISSRYETFSEQVFIELRDATWEAGSLLQVKVGGHTQHSLVIGPYPNETCIQ